MRDLIEADARRPINIAVDPPFRTLIVQTDDDRMSALAYAARDQNYAAIRRLYKSGANPALAVRVSPNSS